MMKQKPRVLFTFVLIAVGVSATVRAKEPAAVPAVGAPAKPTKEDAILGAQAWMAALTVDNAKKLRDHSSLPFRLGGDFTPFESTEEWKKAGCAKLVEVNKEEEWPRLVTCLGKSDWPSEIAQIADQKAGTVDASFKKLSDTGAKKADHKWLAELEKDHTFVQYVTGNRIMHSLVLALKYKQAGSRYTQVSAIVTTFWDEGR